ncbi:MAG TPA: hypothetical protein VLR92_02155 [Blastocatellia bacterium]|nr:hypothetical protein [Blastocatellia bacterium]
MITERFASASEGPRIEIIAQQIDELARKLFGRSLHIREIDGGSCNACELEIAALSNPYYHLDDL